MLGACTKCEKAVRRRGGVGGRLKSKQMRNSKEGAERGGCVGEAVGGGAASLGACGLRQRWWVKGCAGKNEWQQVGEGEQRGA